MNGSAGIRVARAAAGLVTAAALLAGCAATPPDRYYRLTLRDAPSAPLALSGPPPVLAVAAATVPELVDRPQMVTRGPGSQVRLSDQHRWAEPLKVAVARLVAERLSSTLGGALVSAYPAEAAAGAAYRISLDVQRFDSELGVAAETTVLWTLRRLADGRLVSGRRALRTPVADASHDALADAHAQALGLVADEIARGIAEQTQAPR